LLVFEPARHLVSKTFTIDSKRAAGGQLVLIGRSENERPRSPPLLMQQANRIAGPIVGAEGVGAYELGKRRGLMRLGALHWAHLMQDDRNTGRRELPGGFAAGQATADDVHHSDHGR